MAMIVVIMVVVRVAADHLGLERLLDARHLQAVLEQRAVEPLDVRDPHVTVAELRRDVPVPQDIGDVRQRRAHHVQQLLRRRDHLDHAAVGSGDEIAAAKHLARRQLELDFLARGKASGLLSIAPRLERQHELPLDVDLVRAAADLELRGDLDHRRILATIAGVSRKSRRFLGMLTPSSNTTLEPVVSRMLEDMPGVSAHFGRFRVTEISLSRQALGQFTDEPMLSAAELLADARCHSICWNGTSAGWLGFDTDRKLCAKITERTGIPACSSVLAIDEIFRRTGVKRFGMVSPYTDDIQDRIVANFRREGFECVAETHERLKVNFSFSEVEPDTIEQRVREVARENPQAIIVFCTNMDGATPAERLEAELGIPVYDTIATAVWASLRVAQVDPRRLRGWGRLFREIA